MTRLILARFTIRAVIVALSLSACSQATIDPIEGSTVTTAGTAATTSSTTTLPTTTMSEAPTTTAPERAAIDDPLPVGDPNVSGFIYSDFGEEWEGFVIGLVESATGGFNDEEGRCLVLLGTLTPTEIEGGAVTNPFNTPSVLLIAAGGLVDSEVSECDVDDIEAAGYGWILDAEVTVGTTYPFYAEFFLPGTSPVEPEVIVLGKCKRKRSFVLRAHSPRRDPSTLTLP